MGCSFAENLVMKISDAFLKFVAASVTVSAIFKLLLWFNTDAISAWLFCLVVSVLCVWLIAKKYKIIRTAQGALSRPALLAFFVGALGLSLFLVVLEVMLWIKGDSVPRYVLMILFVTSLASLPLFCFGNYKLFSLLKSR